MRGRGEGHEETLLHWFSPSWSNGTRRVSRVEPKRAVMT